MLIAYFSKKKTTMLQFGTVHEPASPLMTWIFYRPTSDLTLELMTILYKLLQTLLSCSFMSLKKCEQRESSWPMIRAYHRRKAALGWSLCAQQLLSKRLQCDRLLRLVCSVMGCAQDLAHKRACMALGQQLGMRMRALMTVSWRVPHTVGEPEIRTSLPSHQRSSLCVGSPWTPPRRWRMQSR